MERLGFAGDFPQVPERAKGMAVAHDLVRKAVAAPTWAGFSAAAPSNAEAVWSR